MSRSPIDRLEPTGAFTAGPSARGSVAVVDAPDGGYVDSADLEQREAGSGIDVRLRVLSQSEVPDLARHAPECIILWHRISLTAEFFALNSSCRAVVCASVGHEHVDTEAARASGVAVYHVPDYGVDEVADHTLALALTCVRRVRELDAHVRGGGWEWRRAEGIRRLRGSTWGVVGCGRIGQAVARRAGSFGMRVAFYDPYVHPGTEKAHGWSRLWSLHDLLAASAVVSVHVPLTPETAHLLDRAALETLAAGAVLVNTSRGAVVDEEALRGVLDEGRPGAVALDVAEHEPGVAAWLREHPRVLLTPHSAFYSVESMAELRCRSARAAAQVLRGEPVTAAVRVV
ncbi:putative dehydrogenase [Actinacidiphila reveromycinica]|uniref:Putative dehydrogenase n=1 Tax=Actinacidiphila reveromycinica TaxID=659352 RepID=A0A7U3V044_9ACTN|nr:C-terminal binding protein [Streptomyces sp. SN-593]BBB01895.1 putative dehydrogenase [Streptomyces sp. SN-593]